MINPNEKREAALLSWIHQFAPYGVITLDEALRVQSWNNWMEIHSGLRVDEVAGKNLFDLFPDLAERKLAASFERALGGEPSVLSTALHRYLLPLQSPLHHEGSKLMRQTARIAPLRTDGVVCGVVIVIEDVTQRENQADALSRQHRRDETLSWALGHFLKTEEPQKSIRQLFFKIAEHLDFDTFLVYFRDVDQGSLTLHTAGGIPTEAEKDFANCHLFTDVAQSPEPVVFNAVNTRGEPEYAVLRNAGISAAIAIPLFANNRSLGLLCFATWSRERIETAESDLSATIAQYLATAVDRENTSHELQNAQAELSNHAQVLEKKVAERTSQLQETISELETFSYTLAHDLKAPVRAMSGYCQILLDDFGGLLPPGADLIIQRLARTPKRMEALIQDLLEFSEVSRQDIALYPVSVESIIGNVLQLRSPEVREATTICSPLHSVRAHKALLQQVLSNLLDNAVKFVTPQTRPRITICTEVMPRSSPSTRVAPLLFNSTARSPIENKAPTPETLPSIIRIWISDEGIGIPPEAHQRIFGIFERGAAAKAYEGTGMGLAIVARAMQRMGGTCGVESAPGNGSRFWVELPSAQTA